MGRSSHGSAAEVRKPRARRVRLDSGGYDNGGAYWGTGEPLYQVYDADGEFTTFVRAHTRDEAFAKAGVARPKTKTRVSR